MPPTRVASAQQGLDMAVSWTVEPGGYLRFVLVGAWSDAATSRATRDELIASGHWHADTRLLVDLRQVTGAAPQFEDLRQRVAMWSSGAIPVRVALLAAPGATYGLGRVLEGLAGPHAGRLRTFEDEPTALAWLLEDAPARSPGRAGAT